jgi:hypothetical protein
LDEFSHRLLAPEWMITELTPDNWESVLEADPAPELLFVESVWRGKDDRWRGQLGNVGVPSKAPSEAVRAMVSAYRDAGIPTVFWNKEDPPNFEVFLESARLFDHVFTVASECIPRYVEDLGHERVHLLPFSAQPKIHNPVRVGPRDHDVAFAGSYYAEKHPERRRQMGVLLDPALQFGLEIFARPAPAYDRYRWPDRFQGNIVGSLRYDEMVVAYKLFKMFINVNSVGDSESMCARRIFELAACNTPVVSGTSPAIDKFFGSDILQVDSTADAEAAYERLLGSEEVRARLAHAGLRTVMRHHTASRRVDHVMDVVGLEGQRTPPPPAVSLLAIVDRPERMSQVMDMALGQSYPNYELIVHCVGFEPEPHWLESAVAHGTGASKLVIEAMANSGEVIEFARRTAEGELCAVIDPDSYYGPEYLHDLIDALFYSEADVVGKGSHYEYRSPAEITLMFAEHEHSYVDSVHHSALMVPRRLLVDAPLPGTTNDFGDVAMSYARAEGALVYSADRFNFVSGLGFGYDLLPNLETPDSGNGAETSELIARVVV